MTEQYIISKLSNFFDHSFSFGYSTVWQHQDSYRALNKCQPTKQIIAVHKGADAGPGTIFDRKPSPEKNFDAGDDRESSLS